MYFFPSRASVAGGVGRPRSEAPCITYPYDLQIEGFLSPSRPQSRFEDKLLGSFRAAVPFSGQALLGLQSRFRDKPLKFQVIHPPNGAAVLKGLINTPHTTRPPFQVRAYHTSRITGYQGVSHYFYSYSAVVRSDPSVRLVVPITY